MAMTQRAKYMQSLINDAFGCHESESIVSYSFPILVAGPKFFLPVKNCKMPSKMAANNWINLNSITLSGSMNFVAASSNQDLISRFF